MNDAAVNTPVQIFVWTCFSNSFDYFPKSGIAGSFKTSPFPVAPYYSSSCIKLIRLIAKINSNSVTSVVKNPSVTS